SSFLKDPGQLKSRAKPRTPVTADPQTQREARKTRVNERMTYRQNSRLQALSARNMLHTGPSFPYETLKMVRISLQPEEATKYIPGSREMRLPSMSASHS